MHSLRIIVTVVVLCAASSASAQQSAAEGRQSAPIDPPPPSINEPSMPAWVLNSLPSAGSLYGLIETIPPDVVAHRIDGGGMYAGTAARIGAHGSSWTQTVFRVGDINISGPEGSGTPLALPGVLEWDNADVNTGVISIESNTPGIVVSLAPRRPSAGWQRQFELTGGPPFMQNGGGAPPPIARLSSYANSSVLMSGPISKHLGVMFTGNYAKARRYERASTAALDGAIGSAFAHLVYTPSPRNEMRTVMWAQQSTAPVDHPLTFQNPGAKGTATSLSLQNTWEHKGAPGASSWRAYAAISGRKRTEDGQPASVVSLERLNDSPPWEQIYPGPGSEQAWQIGTNVTLRPFAEFNRRHHVTAGFDVLGGSATQAQWFNGRIGELVNGIPARVWDFSSAGTRSRWTQTTVSAYAADRFMLRSRLTATAGLRFEHIGAAAEGAATPVSWTTLLPRLGLRWRVTKDGRLTWFTNYGRYGYELRLRDLAYGDPSAATANVYDWNAPVGTTMPQPSQVGALIKRWGPGAGNGLTEIDPHLQRPHLHEIVTGLEYRAGPKWVARISLLGRVDRVLLGLTDPGVPFSAYTVSTVLDKGVDIVNATTMQPLPIYDRPLALSGQDHYVLTNYPPAKSNFGGVDVAVRWVGPRLLVLFGGTAGRSEGWASNRGYRYDENDTTVLGEVFADPNAYTFAKGRTFTERGYTLKLSGAATLPHDIRLGVAARYQDGQHFSRLVLAPDLTQGAEVVRAFANGETRFTFVCTVDTRIQKSFELSGHQFDLMLDAFNLLGLHNEVEELTLTGPTSRETSAVQPPRALHLGIRIPF